MPPGIRPGEIPPFHKLGEYVFQELCRDLFDKEPGIATCDIYGVRGQSQDGVDLLAHRSNGDGIEVGQCKRYADCPPEEIRKASKDFFDCWDRWSKENVKRFILFVACDLSQRQRQDEILIQKQRFTKHGIVYEAWSGATIRNKLRPHPDIVSTYCVPSDYWIGVICGVVSTVPSSSTRSDTQTSVVVSTAMASMLEKLSVVISSETEQRLEQMRTAWREGRLDEANRWLIDLKGDSDRWRALSAQVKAKVLRFEAGLTLDMTGDIAQATRLADEAKNLSPSDNQARLRALITYKEKGPEAALELLKDQEDIESLNLKAAFLLEMGRVEDCLEISDSLELEA